MEDGKVSSIAQELAARDLTAKASAMQGLAAKASASQELAARGLATQKLTAARRGAARRCPSVDDAAAVAAREFAAEFGMRLQCGGLDALGDAAALLGG